MLEQIQLIEKEYVSVTFYRIIPGSKASGGSGAPLASDVNQYAKAFEGVEDVGTITLAPQVAAPAGVATATVIAGSGLGIGTYTYALTYITGHRRDDGTIQVNGETTAGPTWTATTSAGNAVVHHTSLPFPPVGTILAKRLYRTVANGSLLKLVITLGVGVATYDDTTADANLGANVPTSNTTGTHIAFTPAGELTSSTVDAALVELGDKIVDERNRFLRIEAEQNVQAWELQAQVIAATESMSGWSGDGFLNAQNEIASKDAAIKVARGVRIGDGYARAFVAPGFSADAVRVSTGTTFSSCYSAVWTPTGDQLLVGGTSSPSTISVYQWNDETKTFTAGASFPNQATTGSLLRHLAVGQATDGTLWLAQFCENNTTGTNVWIYKRVPGSNAWTFVVRPTGVSNNVYTPGDWSSDCTYLACPHMNYSTTTGGLVLFKRTGDSFATVTLPSAPTAVYCFAATFRGSYLFSAWNGTTSNFLAWKVDGVGTWTKLTTPNIGVSSRVDQIAANADGSVILLAGYSSHLTPFVVQRTSDTFAVVSGKFASMPTGFKACGQMAFSPDEKWLAIHDAGASATQGVWLWSYDKAAFTFAPVSPDPFGGATPVPALNLLNESSWHPSSTWFVAYGTATPYIDVFEGTVPASSISSGTITFKTKTLPATCNAVYVLDSFEQTSGTGVARKYDVSLDGGATWDTIDATEIGKVTTLNHSGTSLVVRAVMYRTVSDSSQAKLYWILAFATSI